MGVRIDAVKQGVRFPTEMDVSTHFDSDGDNTAQSIKTSPGSLHYLHVYNPNGAVAFLQLFDLATATVTVGTSTPKQSYVIPAGGAYEMIATNFIMKFEVAISYACTTTPTGNGDPATGLTVNAHFT